MRLRRTRRGYEEIPPSCCEACGTPFTAGQVLVGVAHCSCSEVRLHRSHSCLKCGEVTFTPPMGSSCRPQSLDGRSQDKQG